ncbi:hypothetical protein [Pontibacter oryzae]|uniref:ABC transporter ATP-binding protein n=1 Tax=Pontibacter oryzae TaxID=2304593 RepID=A0A399RTE4_9BACT|nr:hypothetical protein [Pontibacter oryzae]RIJ33524.1 hypothetical protein D1627_18090 [Pontibacter oryzae]
MPKVADTILEGIGRQYLHLRLRSQERVERELQVKYEGRYRNAAIVLLADIFMALAVVAFVVIIAAALYFVVS